MRVWRNSSLLRSAKVTDLYGRHLLLVCPQNPLGNLDLNVSVLTHTHWPIALTVVPCTLPAELNAACEVFRSFYLKMHSGRKLTYHPNMGSADVRANFPKRTHEVTVPTGMMAILMLFNDRDTYTFQELQDILGLPVPELTRHLQALVLGKYRLLLKESKSKSIAPEDKISYNDKFTANLYRLKIQQIATKAEQDPERKETQDRIEEDRKYEYPLPNRAGSGGAGG